MQRSNSCTCSGCGTAIPRTSAAIGRCNVCKRSGPSLTAHVQRLAATRSARMNASDQRLTSAPAVKPTVRAVAPSRCSRRSAPVSPARRNVAPSHTRKISTTTVTGSRAVGLTSTNIVSSQSVSSFTRSEVSDPSRSYCTCNDDNRGSALQQANDFTDLEWECPICFSSLDPFVNVSAVICCGQLFCTDCIQKVYHSEHKVCPLCRNVLTEGSILHIKRHFSLKK